MLITFPDNNKFPLQHQKLKWNKNLYFLKWFLCENFLSTHLKKKRENSFDKRNGQLTLPMLCITVYKISFYVYNKLDHREDFCIMWVKYVLYLLHMNMWETEDCQMEPSDSRAGRAHLIYFLIFKMQQLSL